MLNNLKGQKKGKIELDQLGEMLKIAQAYKKKAVTQPSSQGTIERSFLCSQPV